MAEHEPREFDPSKYLTRVGGSDYLEVKWRLVWLRAKHPDAEIDTELKTIEPDEAIFKATIRIPGGGSATGWGSETAGDFRDFVEKAETKAIGRALAALGFGTQFSPDHEFGAGAVPGTVKVVDSPVDFTSTRGRRLAEHEASSGQRSSGGTNAVTPRQLKFIQAIAREAGIAEENLQHECETTYGVSLANLTTRDASAFIERLQVRRNSMADLADLSPGTPAAIKPAPRQSAAPEPGPPAGEQPALIAVSAEDFRTRIDAATTQDHLTAIYVDLEAAKAPRDVWDHFSAKARAINTTN